MTFYMYKQVCVVGCNDPLGCVTDRVTLTMKHIYTINVLRYHSITVPLTIHNSIHITVGCTFLQSSLPRDLNHLVTFNLQVKTKYKHMFFEIRYNAIEELQYIKDTLKPLEVHIKSSQCHHYH